MYRKIELYLKCVISVYENRICFLLFTYLFFFFVRLDTCLLSVSRQSDAYWFSECLTY